MNKIKIGWGEVSLTPKGRKVELAGQFYERISDVVETEIYATALAIESGDDVAIFCSCDLVSTSTHLLEEVRSRLKGKDGFPTDKLMISAIHTHTSVGYAGRSDGAGSGLSVLSKLMPEDKQYKPLVKSDDPNLLNGKEALAFLADRIAEAALKAWNCRSDGMYAQGFARAAVGMCRRVCSVSYTHLRAHET